MTFRLEEYQRKLNFEKTMRILRGDVPPVRSLAILAALQPPGASISLRDETWDEHVMAALKNFNFNPVRIKCCRRDFLTFEEFEESFLVPHMLPETAVYLARGSAERVIFIGKKRSLSDESFIFDLYQRDQSSSKWRSTPAAIYIPFFDDVLAGLTPECDVDLDVSFIEAELPKTERVREIIEEIRAYERLASDERFIEKRRWSARGIMNIWLEKLKREMGRR